MHAGAPPLQDGRPGADAGAAITAAFPDLQVNPMLDRLDIHDLRPRLKVDPEARSRRKRTGSVTGATLHYNGPPVAGFGTPEREVRQLVDVDVPWQQRSLGADSLMYHFAILSDGTIHQTRDLDLIAWHCRNTEGNNHSLAVHLPLGGVQRPSAKQWDATVALLEAIMGEYGLEGRGVVKGHLEWASTECPGPVLMQRLREWRAGPARAEPGAGTGALFRVRRDVSAARVRTRPTREAPVALDGRARMFPGDVLDADAVEVGEAIGGEKRWARRRDGLGYVHLSLLTPVR